MENRSQGDVDQQVLDGDDDLGAPTSLSHYELIDSPDGFPKEHTASNQEINEAIRADSKTRAGFDSTQRRQTLSPGTMKRVLVDADIRSSQLYQDLSQEKSTLESSLAQLQGQLESKEAEKQQLQAEVQNL